MNKRGAGLKTCHRISVVVVAVALLPLPLMAHASEGSLVQAVDKVFADIEDHKRPGCAVGVIRHGEYILQKGYGLANLEYGLPVTSQTVFRTGSVSKQFTAMAIALLAEEGRLDLDADVRRYLPELRDYGKPVTIRQMVHHVAGMGDYDPDLFRKADGSEFRFGNEDYWTIAEFYAAVRDVPLRLEPGTRWEYSNLGYFLLSQVVERVSGLSLRRYAENTIFEPLGMSHSMFYDNVNELVKNRADGYSKTDDGRYELYMTNLSWVGDGGVYTSLDDFIAWDRNWTNNTLGKGEPALIELATTPLPGFETESSEIFGEHPAYAFGLFVSERDGVKLIGHSGGWVGFSSVYLRFPEKALSVVTFCNSTDVSAPERGNTVATIALKMLAQVDGAVRR